MVMSLGGIGSRPQTAVMKDARTKVFRLLETADNFLEHARAGSQERARGRARKRDEEAAAIGP